MRHVPKGQPPRHAAFKGDRSWLAIQDELRAKLRRVDQEFKGEAAQRSGRDIAREVFETTDRQSTAAAMLAEQRHLCVFCEQAIVNDLGTSIRVTRRAHWTPIDVEPDRAMDWRNLYASCSNPHTCDNRQGNRDLGLPHPCDVDLSRALTYHQNGELSVSEQASAFLTEDQCSALRIAVGKASEPHADRAKDKGDKASTLNLNHPGLREARKAAVTGARKALQQQFAGRHVDREERRRLAEAKLAQDHRPAFVSTVVAWLIGAGPPLAR